MIATHVVERFGTLPKIMRASIADLVETTPSTLMMMRDGKLLMPYFSPHLANFPDDSKEEADKGRVLWATDRESIVGLGYNRNLIRAAEVPKSFAELVKPENKDTLTKIAKKFGVTIEQILAVNPGIKDPNKVGIGDKIVIPRPTPSVANTSSRPSAFRSARRTEVGPVPTA